MTLETGDANVSLCRGGESFGTVEAGEGSLDAVEDLVPVFSQHLSGLLEALVGQQLEGNARIDHSSHAEAVGPNGALSLSLELPELLPCVCVSEIVWLWGACG